MWFRKPRICGIVDGYSSGNRLARAFRKRGFRCIHIQSTPEIFPINQSAFRPQDFIANLRHLGNFEETLESVRSYDPKVLIPGAEEGVELADRLSEALGLVTNGSKSSPARRNKFEMAEALHRAGLRSIRTKRSADLREILEWIERETPFPVVIKPPESSGADGVRLCGSRSDVEEAFRPLLGAQNRLGGMTREVVAQTFVEGEEFLVNTLSWDGVHLVTDLWRSVKAKANDRDFLYDYVELVDLHDDRYRELTKYVSKVLDAVGVRFGPAHSEVLVTRDGPVLLEVGARLCGGSLPSLVKDGLGIDPVEMVADVYSNPKTFGRYLRSARRLRKHVRLISLIVQKEGVVRGIPGAKRAEQLRSFDRFFMNIMLGTKLEKTIDVFSCPGDVILSHEDENVVREDYRTIREIEKEGFFELT
ncbi:MAG: ATP-grasp domain-containing protein [Pseudomonadota bacterium]